MQATPSSSASIGPPRAQCVHTRYPRWRHKPRGPTPRSLTEHEGTTHFNEKKLHGEKATVTLLMHISVATMSCCHKKKPKQVKKSSEAGKYGILTRFKRFQFQKQWKSCGLAVNGKEPPRYIGIGGVLQLLPQTEKTCSPRVHRAHVVSD